MIKGFFFGLALVLTLIKLSIGLPALLLYIIMHIKELRTTRLKFIILLLIVFKIIWMILIHILLSNKSHFSLLQTLTPDIILSSMLLLRINLIFLKGFFIPLICLFIVDFIFNLSLYLFGFDLVGRGQALRDDDFLPRLSGVFGHPFYSINISFVSFIIGFFIKSKLLIFASLLSLFATGSLRGPLTGVLILVILVLVYFDFKKRNMLLVFFAFASCVFLVTIFSAENAQYVSGNYLRVIAWKNALIHIINNPILGYHSFLPGDFTVMNVETIINYGISESAYLQYALDFGLIPMLITIIVFFILFTSSYRQLKFDRCKENTAIYIFACVALVDSAYGTIYGSVYTTVVYSALLVSYTNHE